MLKRTKSFDIKNTKFIYSIIKKEFYFGFELIDDFFIATPEKALADAIYLTALKRYNCDFEAIDFRKVNRKMIRDILTRTNDYTVQFWEKLCKTYRI
ncbi:MAG: hypothetical protein N3A61_00055 [Ignavibacteria bacterium]|nr:hypothetical protein [Ignavibacteria bacterium]